MPLSPASGRELIHTRRLDLNVYRRGVDLFDVEGHITDVKPFTHYLVDSCRAAGEPVHDMWLRLTFDRSLTVVEAQAKLDAGAHDLCSGVAPNFETLVGLRMRDGWNRGVRERVGRTRGCTHLVEMLAQMATAAIQAMWSVREPETESGRRREERELPPGLLNNCYGYREHGEFVRVHFPRQYRAKAGDEPA